MTPERKPKTVLFCNFDGEEIVVNKQKTSKKQATQRQQQAQTKTEANATKHKQ